MGVSKWHVNETEDKIVCTALRIFDFPGPLHETWQQRAERVIEFRVELKRLRVSCNL